MLGAAHEHGHSNRSSLVAAAVAAASLTSFPVQQKVPAALGVWRAAPVWKLANLRRHTNLLPPLPAPSHPASLTSSHSTCGTHGLPLCHHHNVCLPSGC